MSWISDRIRDVGRALRSDEAKLAIGAGLGGYGLFGKAAMNKFLTSSMLKNMASRYATSYLTNAALGRPHSHRGALSSALWSLPFQAWKNYGLTQPLMGGEGGKEILREGTDTPWWKLMLGQGTETDPELGFMDMFTKDVPIYGEGEGDALGLAKILGGGPRGDITGYKKGFDWLGLAPEVMGYTAADYTPEEKWDAAKRRTEREQEHYNKLMMNPYYQYSGYQWPGWGLGANRGGIMQKLDRGGDFLEDLMAQEEDPMMEDISESALEMARDRQPTGPMSDDVLAQSQEDIISQIPPEILQGIVNQREPMMEKLMQMIMNMYAHTFPEGMEDPGMAAMGPHSMGSIDDMANVGMMGGGDYTMGAHVMGPGTGTSDSINAKLSDGEFVMTAEAVKNLGGGDRYAGARKMYNMMNALDPNSARPGEEPQIV